MSQAGLAVSVIGTGYLGATQAACLADMGYDVVGFDVNPDKVARLQAGDLPFYEPGLPEVLHRGLESGLLRFTTDPDEVASHGDVHFLCVGTPQKPGSLAADLTQVNGAIDMLAPRLKRPCVVVGKSTVPVGTAARLRAQLRASSPAGQDVDLAWSPEFLREGHAVADTVKPDRIVFGVAETGGPSEKALRVVHEPMLAAGIPLLVTDLATAELVKTAANAFLATKISFINAMAELCEAAGADIVDLSLALGQDPRIGNRFLQAGLGFGGGCLPKDIRAFMARAGELGVDQALTFLREVDEINMRRRIRAVDISRQMLGGSFIGRVVAVLGAAFKPESDDIRDSPALNVAAQMQLQGAQVRVFDPRAMANAAALFPSLNYTIDVTAALSGAHLVLLATEWDEFRALDPSHVATLMAERRLLDTRNVLNLDQWRGAGFEVRALGRSIR